MHGGPGAHHDYLLPQMLELSDEYEMVFYDQRGGGKSKTPTQEPITWETQVDDLGLAARELITGPLTLVGYSWGALLSLLYATHLPAGAPAPVRLVLISPASVARRHRLEFEKEMASRQAAPWVAQQRAALQASGLRDRDPEAYRQRAFELSVAGYFAHPENAHSLTQFRVTSRVQQSIWESLGDFDLGPALRALRLPSLVIHGKQDPIPVASSEEIAAALGADLVVLDDCGHVPYVEQPVKLFAAVREFLSRTSTSE
jgi:proline iminopeptidase